MTGWQKSYTEPKLLTGESSIAWEGVFPEQFKDIQFRTLRFQYGEISVFHKAVPLILVQ